MQLTKETARMCLQLTIIFAVSACSQTGDFDRVRQTPASIFDPRPGQSAQGNFVLLQTDEEKQMQRSTHRFVSTIDGQSWLSAIRTTAKALGGAFPHESDYYQWLRVQPYGASSGRYATLLNEIEIDTMTLPAAFASICAVQETDKRRVIAVQSVTSTSQQTIEAISKRQIDNNRKVGGFVAVIGFRYDSYSYALEQLLVETPHNSARNVDNKLNTLAVQVQAAHANQFC